MQIAENIVMVLHIIASLVLIVVVLLQSGKAAGLSGSIAGGAETFLEKIRAGRLTQSLRSGRHFAILFLATSIALALIIKWLAAAPVA